MSENIASSQPRKSRWLKILVLGLGTLVVLLAGLYLIGTSAWCFKSVILPKVSQATGAAITVEDASLSPFSSVTLSGLKVQTSGAEPLLAARQVVARYDLRAILRGDIRVEELTLSDPVLNVVYNADGTSNLDPFTKRPSAQPAPAQGEPPPKLDIKRVAFNNARLHYSRAQAGGDRMVADLSGLNFTAEDLKNGQPLRLNLGAALQYSAGTGTNLAELAATLRTALSISLGMDLMPTQVKGEADLAVTHATGAFAETAQLNTKLVADLGMTEIKEFGLGFSRSGVALGSLSVSGPFDLKKLEGKLNVVVTNIGAEVLNLAGARSQASFANTRLAVQSVVELKNQARVISAAGTVTGQQFSLKREDLVTPVLDLQAGYDVALDLLKTNALVRAFKLDARQAGRPLLSMALAKPMALDWSKGAEAVDESSLTATLEQLNLAEWKAFLGTNIAAGTVNSKLALNIQKAGKLLGCDLSVTLAGLDARFGSNHLAEAGLELGVRGQVTDFAKVNFSALTLNLSRANQPLASLKGAGQFDAGTQDADLQLAVEASLPETSKLLSRPDLDLAEGALKFTGHVTQKNKTPAQTNNPVMDRTVAGVLLVTNLTGRVMSNRLEHLEASADLDVAVQDNLAEIRKCQGLVRVAGLPGGGFEATGRYHLTNQTGTLELKLADLNQNALAPFLGSALGEKKLDSISINAGLSLRSDAATGQQAKGGLQIGNLVVSDPSGAVPKMPFALALQLDATQLEQIIDLRQCQLSLSAPQQATNTLDLTGKVDQTKSNAITGALKLASERLDLTSWYNLLGDKKPAAATAGAGSSETSGRSVATSGTPETDAPVKELPLRDFAFDVEVRQLLLREIAVSNLVVKTRVDGSKIDIRPLQLFLNGAAVNAALGLNLGVPGYQYTLDLSATNTPLTPLVNSFQPERKGKLSGTLTTFAQLKGAGTTPASAGTNLSGRFDVGSTNLNLQLADVRMPLLKSLIAIVVGIPEMMKNPGGAVGSLLSGLSTPAQGKGDWTDQINRPPIDSIDASGQAAGGRITLEQAAVFTPTFRAMANGVIKLAPIMTNSTMELPVKLSLSRPLAEKAGLAGNTPTNEAFAKLPDFLTMKGTFGKPKPDTDWLVLAKTALNAGQPAVDNAKKALKTWLEGKPAQTNSAANTNSTTNTPAGGLLDRFLNRPATGTNAPATNQGGLFKLLGQ